MSEPTVNRTGKCSRFLGTVFVPGTESFKGRRIPNLCIDQSESTNQMTLNTVSLMTNQFKASARDTSTGAMISIVATGDAQAVWGKYIKVIDPKDIQVEPMPKFELPFSLGGFNRPNQPQVMIPGEAQEIRWKRIVGAKELCEARGMRLLHPLEWEYAAGGPNHFDYSTRDGKVSRPGVHYCIVGDCPGATRDVGAAKGHYMQWGGVELYDMSGNVGEWTYDAKENKFYVSGGSCDDYELYVRVSDHHKSSPDAQSRNIGFRCGVAQD